MLYGYARVSTAQQDTSSQRAAFKAAGVHRVVSETASGARERPALDRLLQRLKPGDVLVVYKLDRLARSLIDLMRVIDAVQARGAAFRSLTEPVDTGTPSGRLLLHLLGAVAEFERAVIRERCEAGRVAARARGVFGGRPRRICYRTLADLRAQGLTFAEIGRRVGCAPGTAVKALARVRAGLSAL